MFSFHLYYFSFYLRYSRLVRWLVNLYLNANVPEGNTCINKVPIPYHTIKKTTKLKVDLHKNCQHKRRFGNAAVLGDNTDVLTVLKSFCSTP